MNKATLKERMAKRLESMEKYASKTTKYDKGTPHGKQDNYASGAVFELWASGNKSAKATVSKQFHADLLKNIDNAEKHGGLFSVVECKVQSGDISELYHNFLDGTLKIDFVVYFLRKPYQNPKHKQQGFPNYPLYPVIMTAKEFCEGVTLYALRKNKSNGTIRGGQKDYCIEPNSPKWTNFIEMHTIYCPNHHYTLSEIVGETEINFTEEDFSDLENLFSFLA